MKTRFHRGILFGQAWILLVVARLFCKIVPFKRLYQMAGQSALLPSPYGAVRKIEEVREAIDRATRWVPRSTCLTRGIGAAILLRISGLPYRLIIGVAKPVDRTLSAHAWVVSGEHVVVGDLPNLSSYAALPLDAAIRCLPRLKS